MDNNYKIEIKCYKNSIHDVNLIFNRVYLSNTWVRTLPAKLEETFGEIISGAHTITSAALKTFSLTRNLIIKDFSASRNSKQLPNHGRIFDSKNILIIRINKLFKKVSYFNNHYIYHTGTGTRPYLSNKSNDIDINTAEYINVINNKFDTVINPITNIILIPFKKKEN